MHHPCRFFPLFKNYKKATRADGFTSISHVLKGPKSVLHFQKGLLHRASPRLHLGFTSFSVGVSVAFFQALNGPISVVHVRTGLASCATVGLHLGFTWASRTGHLGFSSLRRRCFSWASLGVHVRFSEASSLFFRRCFVWAQVTENVPS